ncbi:MAG TPA: rRNA maturation RNase YbeY [Acidimicrobiia bacterium]|nr:rRNA maturation RNase YbeY [Acidimicrobiia bacterium]
MTAPPTAIQVFGSDEQDVVDVDVLRWLRLAQLVLREEHVPPDAEVSLVFIDRDPIADLNRRFLDGDGPTDVLAFPMGDDIPSAGRAPDAGGRGPGTPASPDELPVVLGDVVVCPEVARDQAQGAGHDLDDELALLVVHGLLHLLDYDHHDPDETVVMRRREQELLDRFRREETAASPAPGSPAPGSGEGAVDGHE